MKKLPFYFLTLFVFCSSICLAQTENNSPLMMIRRGGELHEDPTPHLSSAQKTEKERRAEGAQDSSADSQEERGSGLHASELQESLITFSETNQNDDAAIRDLKSPQVELITSKIDFLKDNHPDQTDLISLLESYLQKYEVVLDLRTFDQWRTDVLLQESQKVEFAQQFSSNPYATKAQQSILNLLTCEHEILNALLAEPVQLERAQAYNQIRSIHALSKDAFENASRQLEQKSEYDKYIRTEMEYYQAREAYYKAIEEHYQLSSENHNTSQRIKNLFAIGFAKKREFKVCEENLSLYHGSLEKVKQLQQQCLIVSDAMAKSGSFSQQKAATLEYLLIPSLGQQEIRCHQDHIASLDLLAQDHLSLAQAIIEENTVATEHIKKLVSFALQAKSAFEHQFSTLQEIKSGAVTSSLIDSYEKSFHLFQEADQSFLSAYCHLKDQGSSMTDHQSQDSYHRGLNLMNTALIFQLPLIPHEQRNLYPPDWLTTVEAAQHHAEKVIQNATDKEIQLYHESITSFLYEKILALNSYFEALSLKNSIAQNSPSSYFLEQSASQFLNSSNDFQQLSQLSSSQLDLPETKLLIKAAVEAKTQAARLLLQTQNLIFPPSATSAANQNQDLHSLSD